MADLGTIQARVTTIPASWLQDVNDHIYRGSYFDNLWINPRDPRFGAKGDGIADDTAALQAAIDAAAAHNLPVVLCGGTYKANNLTSSANRLCIIGIGYPQVEKNANGPLLTLTGMDCIVSGVYWRGNTADHATSFTGDGVVMTGARCTFEGGGQWHHGRALKMTGTAARIKNNMGILQTNDPSAGAYDVEVGSAAAATLYHHIEGIYTSQASGGLLMIECGTSSVIGGQIGKLTSSRPVSHAGTGNNTFQGMRILGNALVEHSNDKFVGCAFGAVNLTIGSGTSNVRVDLSNVFANGHSITNNGNANSYIERQVSAGSTIDVLYGDDASTAILSIGPDGNGQFEFSKDVYLKNGQALWLRGSSGTLLGMLTMTAGNSLQLVGFSGTSDLRVLAAGAAPTQIGGGAWNSSPLRYGGAQYTWVDSSNRLRIKNGTPDSDTDGVVVGTQT